MIFLIFVLTKKDLHLGNVKIFRIFGESLSMEKLLLYDREFYAIFFTEKYQCIEIHWKNGLVASDDYRQAFIEAYNYFVENKEEKNIKYFLSDIRQQGVISPEDRKWFQQEMVPKVDAEGLRRAAVVFGNKDPFKRYYINTIMRWVNRNYTMKMKAFKSEEDAYKWFQEDSEFDK